MGKRKTQLFFVQRNGRGASTPREKLKKTSHSSYSFERNGKREKKNRALVSARCGGKPDTKVTGLTRTRKKTTGGGLGEGRGEEPQNNIGEWGRKSSNSIMELSSHGGERKLAYSYPRQENRTQKEMPALQSRGKISGLRFRKSEPDDKQRWPLSMAEAGRNSIQKTG